MFEKTIITGFADEIDPMLRRQLEVLKKLGISYIEMRGVDGKNLMEYNTDEAKRIKTRLSEAGVYLSSIGSPIGKINVTDPFAPHMEYFKHAVELAHIMETPYIRVFSFFIPNGMNPQEYRGEVLERMGELISYAAKNNVVLLHENEKEIYGDTALRCLDLMQNFYGDHFKAVFDFANFVQCHQETQEAYKLLKPYVAYIHIKDAVWSSGEVVPAGMGDGHIKEILQQLKHRGYEGYLSLEPHLTDFVGFSSLETDGVSIKHDKKLTGEESFTLAYEALRTILKEI